MPDFVARVLLLNIQHCWPNKMPLSLEEYQVIPSLIVTTFSSPNTFKLLSDSWTAEVLYAGLAQVNYQPTNSDRIYKTGFEFVLNYKSTEEYQKFILDFIKSRLLFTAQLSYHLSAEKTLNVLEQLGGKDQLLNLIDQFPHFILIRLVAYADADKGYLSYLLDHLNPAKWWLVNLFWDIAKDINQNTRLTTESKSKLTEQYRTITKLPDPTHCSLSEYYKNLWHTLIQLQQNHFFVGLSQENRKKLEGALIQQRDHAISHSWLDMANLLWTFQVSLYRNERVDVTVMASIYCPTKSAVLVFPNLNDIPDDLCQFIAETASLFQWTEIDNGVVYSPLLKDFIVLVHANFWLQLSLVFFKRLLEGSANASLKERAIHFVSAILLLLGIKVPANLSYSEWCTLIEKNITDLIAKAIFLNELMPSKTYELNPLSEYNHLSFVRYFHKAFEDIYNNGYAPILQELDRELSALRSSDNCFKREKENAAEVVRNNIQTHCNHLIQIKLLFDLNPNNADLFNALIKELKSIYYKILPINKRFAHKLQLLFLTLTNQVDIKSLQAPIPPLPASVKEEFALTDRKPVFLLPPSKKDAAFLEQLKKLFAEYTAVALVVNKSNLFLQETNVLMIELERSDAEGQLALLIKLQAKTVIELHRRKRELLSKSSVYPVLLFSKSTGATDSKSPPEIGCLETLRDTTRQFREKTERSLIDSHEYAAHTAANRGLTG